MHHQRTDIDRLHIRRGNNGIDLIHLQLSHKTTTVRLKKYLATSTEWILQLVNVHEIQKKKYSASKFAKEIDLIPKEIDINIGNNKHNDKSNKKKKK